MNILKILYDAGVGAKNPQGFGMIEVNKFDNRVK
jgi:CRISPR/Cas system endoribonuclease Cas6 (RAMP superfamily)